MTQLTLTRSTSRARATKGQPVATLRDDSTGQRYRYTGINHDTLGGAVGAWLQDAHQDRLATICRRAWYISAHGNPRLRLNHRSDRLYGVTAHYDDVGDLLHTSLDGSHGAAGILRAAEAIGLQLTFIRNRKGFTVGLDVSDIPATTKDPHDPR